MLELDNYLKEFFFYLGFLDLDVLTWWKTNGFKYLTLQMIVWDIYVILVFTIALEFAFTKVVGWY